MLDHCQEQCADVAGKLAQIFGWRHKYEVQRLQRANHVPNSKSVVVTQVVSRKHSADSWVAVHSLQSQNDGGILDPDDRLNDVADDREQIIATFEDGETPVHHGGDGASGSSVGSPSPDIFQGSDKYRTDIEVTGEQIASGTSLQVRRGSEPALNQLVPSSGNSNGHLPVVSEKTSKRWSAAPIIAEPRDRVTTVRKVDDDLVCTVVETCNEDDKQQSDSALFAECLAEGVTVEVTEVAELKSADFSNTDSDYRWAYDTTVLLLEEYKKRRESFRSGKVKKSTLWRQIQEEFASRGHHVSWENLDAKFRNMKKTYVNICESNSKKIKRQIKWEFFHLFQDIFGEYNSGDTLNFRSCFCQSEERRGNAECVKRFKECSTPSSSEILTCSKLKKRKLEEIQEPFILITPETSIKDSPRKRGERGAKEKEHHNKVLQLEQDHVEVLRGLSEHLEERVQQQKEHLNLQTQRNDILKSILDKMKDS